VPCRAHQLVRPRSRPRSQVENSVTASESEGLGLRFSTDQPPSYQSHFLGTLSKLFTEFPVLFIEIRKSLHRALKTMLPREL
jgi:hypothetical protein